jgi:hypothetical protein
MALIFGKYTPDEAMIQLLVNADQEDFEDLCKREEMRKFCGYTPESERVYHERSLRLFPVLIRFRESSMSWREFYWRVIHLLDYSVGEDLTDIADLYCTLKDNLLELKILAFDRVLPTTQGANSLAANGNLATLQWLAQYRILPNREGVNAAKRNNHTEIISYLQQFGLRPTARALFL